MKKFYEEPEIVVNTFSLTEDILGDSKAETDLAVHEDNWEGFGW